MPGLCQNDIDINQFVWLGVGNFSGIVAGESLQKLVALIGIRGGGARSGGQKPSSCHPATCEAQWRIGHFAQSQGGQACIGTPWKPNHNDFQGLPLSDEDLRN